MPKRKKQTYQPRLRHANMYAAERGCTRVVLDEMLFIPGERVPTIRVALEINLVRCPLHVGENGTLCKETCPADERYCYIHRCWYTPADEEMCHSAIAEDSKYCARHTCRFRVPQKWFCIENEMSSIDT